ncbi:HB2J protein, partial [Alaudala cheleensis]|nr:HB2J protein [Alaudala cheleensis]
SGWFQRLSKDECTFINGTERVKYVERLIYNREQLLHFDSDVGHYVGDTPYGEIQARYWNSDSVYMERKRAAVDTYCRHNYEGFNPHLTER